MVDRLDSTEALGQNPPARLSYEIDDPDTAEEYLRRWITEVDASGLEPLARFARMLEDHWLGVTRSRHSCISNRL